MEVTLEKNQWVLVPIKDLKRNVEPDASPQALPSWQDAQLYRNTLAAGATALTWLEIDSNTGSPACRAPEQEACQWQGLVGAH